MLRKPFNFRGRTPAEAAAGAEGDSPPGLAPLAEELPAGFVIDAEAAPFAVERPPGRRLTKKRIALGIVVCLLLGMGAAYTQKDTLSPTFANYSRRVIGDENTARVESWFFALQDHIDKLKFRVLGGETNPFATTVQVAAVPQAAGRTVIYYISANGKPTESQLTAESLGPAPLQLPQTIALHDNLDPGEGVWSTAGLPHNTATDTLMAKTFVHPDKSRPYATVGGLLMDSRRIRLHMTAGTTDPGGFRGVKGPGTIPQDALSSLLAAWNGGFKGPHGNFGMFSDGVEYVPMRNGLATICVMNDGQIKMGEWGADLVRDDNMAACRQNVVLLVQNGEVSKRTTEGNDTWGYVNVNSSEFITWRSAVGPDEGREPHFRGRQLPQRRVARAWPVGRRRLHGHAARHQ